MANDEGGSSPDSDASMAVRELLGEVPSPTIPSEVSESVLAAIEAESQKRRADSRANVYALQRSSRFRRLLPVAASAAAVGLLGFLVWPQAVDGDAPETFATGTGCTVSADSGADMSPVLHASGATYTEVSLASQAESMAQQPAARCTQAEHGSPTSQSSGTGDSTSGVGSSSVDTGQTELAPSAKDDPARGSDAAKEYYLDPEENLSPEDPPEPASPLEPGEPLEPGKPRLSIPSPVPAQGEGSQSQWELLIPQSLRSEPLVSRCVVALVAGRVVHAIDLAEFNGQPAVVVVVAAPREVLALKCGPGQAKVLAKRAMAR